MPHNKDAHLQEDSREDGPTSFHIHAANGHSNGSNGSGTQGNGFHQKPWNHTNGNFKNGDPRVEQNSYYAGSAQDDVMDFDIKMLVSLMSHNKWIIILTTYITTIFAFLVAFSITPIYESQATIIISQGPNKYSMAGNDISSLLMSSYGIGMGSTIENEVRIMNSRTLALDLSQRLLAVAPSYPPEYFPILHRIPNKDMRLTSPDTVKARILAGVLIGQASKISDIVNITFQSSSAFEAQYIANLMVDVYSDVSTKQNRIQAKAALEFLQRERENLRIAVGDGEERLRRFMNSQRLVSLDTQTDELVKLITRLDIEKRSADVSLASVDQAINRYTEELESLRPGLAGQVAQALAPQLQRFQFQLSELETERFLILAKNPQISEKGEKPARLLQLEKQIDVTRREMETLTKDLVADKDVSMLGFLGSADGGIAQKLQVYKDKLLGLQVERVQLASQADVLRNQLAEYNGLFDNLPDNMIELARIKRDLQINEQLFLTISKQTAEMALWEQTQFGMARVVDYAELPLMPTKPRKKLILIAGFALGAMLSVGFIFGRETLNERLDSVEKLKKKGFPLLAVIPDTHDYVNDNFEGQESIDVNGFQVSTDLLTFLDSLSPMAESYRRLQSNILYSRPDSPYRLMLVTSGNKSEGKSTVTTNLATTLAETGKTVCIVDCDFRRPRLHRMFGLPRTPGVIEKLFSDSPVDEFLQPTVIPNLSVLTAGSKTANPSEICRSQKMQRLVLELKRRFDFVLLDAPPYGIITDAAPLIKMVDAVVLVAKLNQTNSAELDHTIENLKSIDANVIGTVMNAYDKRQTSGYHYADYHYEYSYKSYRDYDTA